MKTADAPPDRSIPRSERRRLDTRRRLIEAARRVMSEKGVDACTINDITEAADVGQGSFYNHFESKAALVAVVIEGLAGEIKTFIEREAPPRTDYDSEVAEVLAMRMRLTLRQALADPITGWFILRMGYTRPDLIRVLTDALRHNLDTGIRTGRFHVPSAATACHAIAGAILATLHAELTGQHPIDAEQSLAEIVLRIAGLDREEAARIAAQPVRTVAAAG
jgi:AcrR family transcriptional regulator